MDDSTAFYDYCGRCYVVEPIPIGSGRESLVYHVLNLNSTCIKVYKNRSISRNKEDKLKAMIRKASEMNLDSLAWPCKLIFDDKNAFAGYAMPQFENNQTFDSLFRNAEKLSFMNIRDKLLILLNFLYIIKRIHSCGYVIGDFNPSNFAIAKKSQVFFYDLDSLQFTDEISEISYPCVTCAKGYLAPELIKLCRKYSNWFSELPFPAFTQYTDLFSIAVIIAQVLLDGRYPYLNISTTNHCSNLNFHVEENTCIFRPRYSCLLDKEIFDEIPENIMDLLRKAFIDGYKNPYKRVTEIEWVNAINPLILNNDN